MDAHLQYFRRGQQVFACLEEYLQQALAVVETKRQEEKAHAGALEDAIDAYRYINGVLLYCIFLWVSIYLWVIVSLLLSYIHAAHTMYSTL